jgi:hypothetical protein
MKKGRERGATIVEAAIVMPMILLLAIGLSEVGFAVIDWLAVSNASREGARVGAAAGDYDEPGEDADDLIKSVVAQASCAIENGDLLSMRVFKSDVDGNTLDGDENLYILDSVNCVNGTSSWTDDSVNWPPDSRKDSVDDLDILGVELTFDHTSITGFLPMFDATWNDTAIMRIEPDTRGTG